MADPTGPAPEVAALTEANRAFYGAFQALDEEAMAAVWETSERVYCVHPGWPPLHGSRSVQESWRRIIGNTGEIRFELTAVQARVSGDVGVVTCFEIIHSKVDGGDHSAMAAATNLFARDGGGEWKLFHHHASLTAMPQDRSQDPPVIN